MSGPNTTITDTLYGLVGCISDKVSEPCMKTALTTLEDFLQSNSNNQTEPALPAVYTERKFSQNAIDTAQFLCDMAAAPALKKKKSWQALQQTAGLLQEPPSEANALAIGFVFGALALVEEETAKAAASAMSSTVSRNKPLRQAGRSVANHVLRAYLIHASYSHALNLNIITHFAKSFKLNEEQEALHASLSSKAILFSLGIPSEGSTAVINGDAGVNDDNQKQRVSGALALACQVRPWPALSPVLLVEAAIPHSYWHAAEQVCVAAHKSAISAAASDNDETLATNKNDPSASALTDAVSAVETLIDAAMEDRTYRLADTIATNLYKEGGKSRYVAARFYHACDTIAKVVYKGQLPIIERQVERVDKAFAKVHGNTAMDSCSRDTSPDLSFSPSQDIRVFAIGQLEEAGEIDAAQRLATIWGMDYVYDEEAALEAAAARRKRYLQFDDVLSGSIPELISDPQELRRAFEDFRRSPHENGPFGLDAEWAEGSKGADLLQLANRKQILLLDIPSLSATEEGVAALEDTVGNLFDSSDCVVVGFACRQDMSRLRASPCARKAHWLSGTRAVVDAQQLAGEDEPKLKKLGLSRVCQHYFGKPLDKSEQCSFWAARPLTERQRCYAAMDAWICVGVYDKMSPHRSSIGAEQSSTTVAAVDDV